MVTYWDAPYVRQYKELRDKMNTQAIIVQKKTKTNDIPIYKVFITPLSREYKGVITEDNRTEVSILIEDLTNLQSVDGNYTFPIKEIINQIEFIRFNEFSYTIIEIRKNIFNVLITLVLSRKL